MGMKVRTVTGEKYSRGMARVYHSWIPLTLPGYQSRGFTRDEGKEIESIYSTYASKSTSLVAIGEREYDPPQVDQIDVRLLEFVYPEQVFFLYLYCGL